MQHAPQLLNEDGSASMATMFMMAHHGLRRDLARFAVALEELPPGDASKAGLLRDEWQSYRNTLHGHHQMEDARVFPHLTSQQQALGAVIDRLSADHRKIDPLLERGDQAFAALPDASAAKALIAELRGLLGDHLALEEAEVVPFLRGAREFPTPASDAEAELYAHGFAWSMYGIAPEVLAQVEAMLPAALTSRLPTARAAFAARCERVWGAVSEGAARTPIPEP